MKKIHKPRIIIVTNAGRKIGFGHLGRCVSLSQAFTAQSIRTRILVDGDTSVLHFAQNNPVELVDWLKNPDKLSYYLKETEIAIIDSLLIDDQLCRNLLDSVKTTVFLDDFIRRDHKQGVIVDWTILAEKKFYPVKHPGAIYLLGSKYASLRQEFWEVPKFEIQKEVRNILVTFGGSDVANMTPKILKLLSDHFPKINVSVVIGPGFNNIEEIKSIDHPNITLIDKPQAQEMKELMFQSDLAIATGGQTIYELARIGVPTVGIMVIDNQQDDVSGWQEVGYLNYAGASSDKNVLDETRKRLQQMLSYDERAIRSQIGQNQVDGKGADRLVKKILSIYEINNPTKDSAC